MPITTDRLRAFRTGSASAALAISLFWMPASVSAQDRQSEESYSQERYEYCRQRAVDLSGYRGPTPRRYRPGGLLEGAARGAATGAVGSLIFGGNSRERRRAARRGAIIGGIIGAIKRGEAKKEEKRRARVYRLELDTCMRAGR